MPLIDGLGFLRRLRTQEHHRETPVVIVTGDYFLDEAYLRRVQALGAELRFKPLWLEDLVKLRTQPPQGDPLIEPESRFSELVGGSRSTRRLSGSCGRPDGT